MIHVSRNRAIARARSADVLMCASRCVHRARTALCAAGSTSIAATQRLTADSAIADAVLGPDQSSSSPVTTAGDPT